MKKVAKIFNLGSCSVFLFVVLNTLSFVILEKAAAATKTSKAVPAKAKPVKAVKVKPAKAKAQSEKQVVEVSTSKAYIWNEPGYSWKDCRPGDEKSNYISVKDKELSLMKYAKGGKEICDSRKTDTDLFESGDQFEVIEVFEKKHDIIISGELIPKGFYKVKAKNGKIGWVSEDQVTRPHALEIEASDSKDQKCDQNYGLNGKNESVTDPNQSLKKSSEEILKAVDKQMPFAGSKKDNEIDHFACLYRDYNIPDKKFLETYPDFQKAAKEAASAFKVPYGMVMCTMMTESSLYFNPKEKDEYRGLGQVGSAFVEDLNKLIRKNPYKEQWNTYKSRNQEVQFTDHSVRNSSDPKSAAVAVALGMSWIYNDRFHQKDVACKDCSRDGNYNRKDLYMMIAGYNWGPYSLKKIVGKSAAQMKSSYPPPEETRDYMSRIENCLAKNHYANFKEKEYDLEKYNLSRKEKMNKLINNQRKLASKTKQPLSKGLSEESQKNYDFLQQMIDSKASIAYERRIKFCAQNFPIK